MKKTFNVYVKIKNCDKIFRKDFPPGVISQQVMVYDIEEHQYDSVRFASTLNNAERELRDDIIETYTTEVE